MIDLLRSRCGLALGVAAVAGFGISCTVGPDYAAPGARIAAQWTPSPAMTNRPAHAAEALWWHALEDPTLNELIETACSNSPTLQIAGVRILETRARLNQTIGSLFPQQQAVSGQLGYSRLNDSLASAVPGMDPDHVSAQILFGASWEMDFWGKYRRGIESDRATYLGSIAAYDDALVTLIADVASVYVNLRTIEERLRVARQNLALQQESLRIASAQFRAGATSERDVQQARAQLALTESQIPLLEQALAQARNGLAVLLGDTPDAVGARLAGPGRIPAVPAAVAAGIPRDLLRRRPDIRAAGLAAASKSALIGVARAQMYPAFSLSGEFGFAGSRQGDQSLADMFSWENRVANAGASLFFPIFHYGRLVNHVRVQDAQFQQAILQYQNAVLVAQYEVENGLAALAEQQRAIALLEQAAAAARRSTDLAMIQYKGGQTDYTTVLTAQQGQLAVEDALAESQGSVVVAMISVYRALGGGWELRQGRDVVSDEVKAQMSRRTNWGRLLEPSGHLPAGPAAAGPAPPGLEEPGPQFLNERNGSNPDP
ncbi:MAG TPA: efflux transporter outer membrane subunit [Candidatus Paceibacterota bacterium]|nr:efflux transporter outer membrane subunit [Verrucomicrobiota bacterium]HRZ44910.1 efflux transporter outer membrane subunit [Candidatus Paceibacterota bacterium]HRZ92345.1 efflux transporter outer membrane subunit [Candidatus Paceibacterota bacterium]